MKIVYLFILVFLLVGCTDQRIIEDVGFIQGMSLDIADPKQHEADNRLLVTVAIPQVDPEMAAKREVLTTLANSDKEAMLAISRKTNRQIVSGQLRTIFFGLELAEHGIGERILTMNRDPIFGPRVKVAVVNGKAHDLLIKDYKQHPRTSRYVDQLLEKEANLNMIPEVRIYQFKRDWMDEGIDPVVPILKKGIDDIIVDGIALFQDDRYVGKIEPKQARVFFFLSGKFTGGALQMSFKEEGIDKPVQVLYSSVVNRRKVNVIHHGPNGIEIVLNISVRGQLLEYNGKLDVASEEGQHRLEREIENYIKAEVEDIIKTMQQINADSIGIGRYVRNSMSYNDWKEMDWREVFPTIQVTCNVEAKIRDFGYFR